MGIDADKHVYKQSANGPKKYKIYNDPVHVVK